MIDFSFTEEQQLFQKATREWAQKWLPLEAVRVMDKTGQPPKGLFKAMGDQGLIIMTAPEAHGGIGADWITACLPLRN